MQNHPDVVAAGQAALHKYGAGLSSVRFICGTQVCYCQAYLVNVAYVLVHIFVFLHLL